MSKKEENLFLENQKIPETLDMYFKNYVQNGDYELLINKARDYICEDNGNVDIVIPVSYTHLTLPTKRIV